MKTNKIRMIIKKAVAVEKQTDNLADAIRGLAMLRGVRLSAEQFDGISDFIREYIEHAPAMLDQIAAAAKKVGAFDRVMPIIDAAQEYFFAPIDIIPDHLGLLGLVDDAYLTHVLIQTVSNWYRDKTGRPLLQIDLTEANQFIHNLIGEPQASLLDLAIAGVVNESGFQQCLPTLVNVPISFPIPGPDPVWGNASMDEIVNVRLGAMGVV